jgi:transcriptional regulator with XRE-family HTH domain
MELGQKLQQLRKEAGLTQEALAHRLFVSRAAVSKWESGRGYPNIESLKSISKVFGISIDDLLSGEELITIAEEDKRKNLSDLRIILYGLLDLMSFIFLFIPLFGQKNGDLIESVAMIHLEMPEAYMRLAYFGIIGLNTLYGFVEILLRNFQKKTWEKNVSIISIVLTIMGTVIFIVSQQPYVAFFMLWILIFKGVIYVKGQ